MLNIKNLKRLRSRGKPYAEGSADPGIEMKELLQLLRSLLCGVLALLWFGWVIMRIRILDSKFGILLPRRHKLREFS
jgi:hypothetical protein